MRLVELSVEKLEELKPYVDTLLLPVCSVGTGQNGELFGQDLSVVREWASKIDKRISGRVFLLPELVHTSVQDGQGGQACMPENVVADYAFHLLLPYRNEGFAKAVLLYGEGTPVRIMEQATARLAEQGFAVLALRVRPDETDLDSQIQEIIQLWNR